MIGWVIAAHAGDAVATGSAGGPPIDVRVIFEFQSPSPQPWNLQLRISDVLNPDAQLSEIENFSQSETTSGSFDLDRSGQTLTVNSRHAISGGKFGIRIRSSREAKLWVEPLGNAGEGVNQPWVREISIADLLRSEAIGSHASPSDAEDISGWTIRRVENDVLRLTHVQPVPLYQPGAPLSLSVEANSLLDHSSRAHVLVYELYRVSDGEIVANHRQLIQIDAYGNSPIVNIDEHVPPIPGVYEIRLQLELDDENIWSRLRRRPPPLARLTHSFAVLHGATSEAESHTAWPEIGVIRPSESTWSVGQWLPKPTTRLIPGSSAPLNPSLETDSHSGQSVSLLSPLSTFQATLPVKTPGYPHRVTIRLPSTTAGAVHVQIGSSRDQAATSFVLENDSTADQRGPWRDHSFIHYPVHDDQIWLTNLDAAKLVAFESVSVQAGPLRITPEATASALPRTAALRLPNVDWTESLTKDVPKRTNLMGCAASTIALNQLWVATERIQDYARASGCNGLVIPANSGARTWYESGLFQSKHDVASPRQHHLQLLLQLLEPSQLRVYVGLKPNMLLTKLEKSIQQQDSLLIELTRSESTTEKMTLDPTVAAANTVRAQYNPLHPMVQNAIGELVKELDDLCNRYEGFSGVVVDCDGDSHLRPPPNAVSDAGSIVLFGRANDMTANVAQLRNWLQQQGTETFQDWQRMQLRTGYEQVGKSASSGMVRILIPGTKPLGSPGPSDPKASTTSIDSNLAPQFTPSAAFIHSFRYGPAGVLSKKSLMQYQLASVNHRLPAILIGEEHSNVSPALVRDQMISDLCRMIHRSDPELLMIESSLLANNLDENLTSTMESFCALPVQALQESLPVDSASHTVRLRSGTIDGHLYVSMINAVSWSSDVDLEVSTPTSWDVIGRAETNFVGQKVMSLGGTRTRVTVPAGQIVVLRSKEPTAASIRSWTTRVTDGAEAIESIKQKVTMIVECIGILSDFKPYAKLTNGGFEQSGGMGLVGWLHAQHPPGCVQIDDNEFVEGAHSIVLATGAPAVARTWLVSETIEPPQSGRLAVSLACRAEFKDEDSAHLLRVSIEATRQGDPIRFTRDLEVPRNGQWAERGVILEADEIDTASIESLRLTIDSLSSGRVWIDDVQLHDRFPTARERAELQSLAFLAVQGLQRGNLLPSGKLLQNQWARHLLSLGPTERSKRVIESLPMPDEAPGVAERIRNWLPRPLRF